MTAFQDTRGHLDIFQPAAGAAAKESLLQGRARVLSQVRHVVHAEGHGHLRGYKARVKDQVLAVLIARVRLINGEALDMPLGQELHRHPVRLDIGGLGTHFGGHVAQRHALGYRELSNETAFKANAAVGGKISAHPADDMQNQIFGVHSLLKVSV
ncbi:hypothetical protein SDC9_152486 [bioreactor metagenome]|uniref:Uncharacterized protein n=1 Tax=bioreactor metagenome TaxID=1076179 RepID=A0A645EUY2_9ZZZZ